MNYLDAYLSALPILVGASTLVWLLSLGLRNAGIVDGFWGLGFVALAYYYSSRGGPADQRALATLLLVSLWGLRLSAHIFVRGRGSGEDRRYQAMRGRWGVRFPVVSLFTVFWLQAFLMWVVSAPLFLATRAVAPGPLGWTDAVGISLAGLGLIIEAVADYQLVAFKANPENEGGVLDSGLWRYSRHPNYFGDFLVWWGFFALALGRPLALWTIVSPVVMSVLLLRVSGVTLLERELERSKPDYRHYTDKTNAFFPWFSR